ncbi:YbaB/EbfC family DNA-binding protein [Mycolicibacterium sp. P1-18]|uniref:YbaB/EbfC family nucleoid-associated protein n=1 Tax=Mycolicibacterium sp. P1-18 TaxID=2024615 RepID=UPI0011F2F672|nr:YbaB/EbfC family nucleoid-associated protein [Mycolicibacterium sp. P1-18]KAA0096633.1 YbaB/EbfC family DNA-binding protein [Mycolicibacterium sp. P1-18]
MSNESIRNEFGQVLALVQEQMRDLANVQQQRSTMMARATAADGMVEVTVNAQRTVVKTVVDDTYLDDHELADLGGHVTSAAQAAVRQLDQRSEALLAPMNERRKAVSEISGNVIGLPGFREALAEVSAMGDSLNSPPEPVTNDGEDASSFPTIRS